MSISTAKMAAALGGAGAVGTGGYFAVKSLPNTPVSIKDSLLKEEYELISEITDKNKREEQYKKTFALYKSESGFLQEVNKHSEGNANISDSDDGEKGKVALEKLCASYLESTDSKLLENSQKWCVLRIIDKELINKEWIVSGTGNQDSDWKSSFTKNKDLLVSLNIEGISSGTDQNAGHSLVKKWCETNTKLIINKGNKDTLANASQVCSKDKVN
ncbi:hypothetical protein HF1_05870 [Mycoplasma haemofelis str. Langford 1]|uniref:Uncharacterized protein n=1 Tax=Mycoplasma haemofelis (strain Langford 1) TaxID=941640 RepID=E8ZHH4_MYCHL|nr:hypothetical protein [Mycoplasma haemofelis]CBY92595.1 hypothetical protein HF1_05870 [Mycoplasma haemofelis str. Langford 1]